MKICCADAFTFELTAQAISSGLLSITAMTAAAVLFLIAVMVLFMVIAFLMMTMVIAVDIRIKCKISCKQCAHRFIRAAGHSSVKADSRLRQRSLRACSNPAANHGIHF